MKIKSCPYKNCLFLCIATFLSAIISSSSVAQSSEKVSQIDAEILLNEAEEQKEAGEFNRAIILLNKAVQAQQPSSNVYYERGLNYFYLKEYKKALEDFNQAIDLHGSLPLDVNSGIDKTYYYRGITRYEWALLQNISQENFDEEVKKSIKDIQLSIQINPSSWLGLLREQSRQPTPLEIFRRDYRRAVNKCSDKRRNREPLVKLVKQLDISRSKKYNKDIDVEIQKANAYIKKNCP